MTRRTPKGAADSRTDSAAGPDAPTLVLVIEDDKSIRRFLRAGLEGQGYRFVEA